MHLRGQMLAEGECYHVFNRGAHKQAIFTTKADYERFQVLLYLLNTKFPILMRNVFSSYRGRASTDIFAEERSDKSLVDILAYSLMPNHFHLVLRQKSEGGISRFMQKVCTAHSMYFNAKYEHSGVVFQGRYKANHIDNEAYFRYIFSYVHLNPLDLFQSDWKEVGIKNHTGARDFLDKYRYASYRDYGKDVRPERSILEYNEIPDFLTEQNDFEELLRWGTKRDSPQVVDEIQHKMQKTNFNKAVEARPR